MMFHTSMRQAPWYDRVELPVSWITLLTRATNTNSTENTTGRFPSTLVVVQIVTEIKYSYVMYYYEVFKLQ